MKIKSKAKLTSRRNRKAMQLSLTGTGLKKLKDTFGGSLLGKNNPKHHRPLETKFPIHLVLRATQGGLNTQKNFKMINEQIDLWARRCGVTVYERANAGNHIHLAIRITKLLLWPKFIRGLTGSIARKIQAAGLLKNESLWKHRPFTRIVRSWRQALQTLKKYVEMNRWEVEGNLDPKHRGTIRNLRKIWREDAEWATDQRAPPWTQSWPLAS